VRDDAAASVGRVEDVARTVLRIWFVQHPVYGRIVARLKQESYLMQQDFLQMY
jgi:hypothetical protein